MDDKFTDEDVERFIVFLNNINKHVNKFEFSNMSEIVSFAKDLSWAGGPLKKKMESNIFSIIEKKDSPKKETKAKGKK